MRSAKVAFFLPASDALPRHGRSRGRIYRRWIDFSINTIYNQDVRDFAEKPYGDDATLWYGNQADAEPGNISATGASTKTDLRAERPGGLEDVENGTQLTNLIALPKPAWKLDSCTIVPEPLEYAVMVPVAPGVIRFFRILGRA